MTTTEPTATLDEGVHLGDLHVGKFLCTDGKVVSARGELDGAKVLVHLLDPRRASEDEARAFDEERALHAQLAHDHVAPFVACGEHLGVRWYARTWEEGPSLHNLHRNLAGAPQRPLGHLATLLASVARALDAAHRAGAGPCGLVHGPLSLETLRIDHDGRVTLGGSQPAGRERALRPAPATSPEEARRRDLLDLGVLAYTLLVGIPPFDGPPTDEALSGGGRRPTDVVPGFPAMLEALLARLLHPDPGRRFDDAAGPAAALELFSTQAGWRSTPADAARWLATVFPAWTITVAGPASDDLDDEVAPLPTFHEGDEDDDAPPMFVGIPEPDDDLDAPGPDGPPPYAQGAQHPTTPNPQSSQSARRTWTPIPVEDDEPPPAPRTRADQAAALVARAVRALAELPRVAQEVWAALPPDVRALLAAPRTQAAAALVAVGLIAVVALTRVLGAPPPADNELLGRFVVDHAAHLVEQREFGEAELALREVRRLPGITERTQAEVARVTTLLDDERRLADAHRALSAGHPLEAVELAEELLARREGHPGALALLERVLTFKGRGPRDGAAVDLARNILATARTP